MASLSTLSSGSIDEMKIFPELWHTLSLYKKHTQLYLIIWKERSSFNRDWFQAEILDTDGSVAISPCHPPTHQRLMMATPHPKKKGDSLPSLVTSFSLSNTHSGCIRKCIEKRERGNSFFFLDNIQVTCNDTQGYCIYIRWLQSNARNIGSLYEKIKNSIFFFLERNDANLPSRHQRENSHFSFTVSPVVTLYLSFFWWQ